MYGNYFLLRRLFYICFDLKCYWIFLATAVAGAVVGAVQTGIGIAERNKARKEQEAALNRMRLVALDKLKYASQLDKDWTDRFGTTTAQVAEYYGNLTADSLKQQYEQLGDKTLEQSYNNFMQQRKQLETKINQMGMQNSSQALSALMQMSTAQMQNNAAVNFETNMNKMKADQEVAQQKLAYNQTGEKLQMAAIQTRNEGMDMQYKAEASAFGASAQREQDANSMINAGIDATTQGLYNMAEGIDGKLQARRDSNTTANNAGEFTDAFNDAYARLRAPVQDAINSVNTYKKDSAGAVINAYNNQNNVTGGEMLRVK